MRDFNHKFPGLNEEQLRVKRKIWEREQELQKQLYEALNKKLPFSYDEGDGDTGDWGLGDFGISHGFVSDAAIAGATVTFLFDDGRIKTTTTDRDGGFDTPMDFGSGDILVQGGVDAVTKLPYKGEFKIDAEFFFKYKSITPLTYLANHVWLNTDTKTPEEALDLVLAHISAFTNLPATDINKDYIFNQDPVKLSVQGIEGSKEIQAINTFLEIHTELMGSTEATYAKEIEDNKKKAYNKLANALLDKINGNDKTLIEVDDMDVEDKYKQCFSDLLNKAHQLIFDHLTKDHLEATKSIQATNLAIKQEWTAKTLEMTAREDFDAEKIWDEIQNKSCENLITKINLPL